MEKIANGTVKSSKISMLIGQSEKVRSHAYCPYSNFPVGAAVLCDSGEIFTGCNVENACYNLGICAERVAISKAISEGHRKFKAIAISSALADSIITPCGGCRQFMAEFGLEWDIYMSSNAGRLEHVKVKDLLPYSFLPETLDEKRVNDLAYRPSEHNEH